MIKYRKDIDGLRAIAVLAVVMYHGFPDLIPGGFVGVDIFFVISGYLISSIIFNNLDNKNFSFIDFYSKRVRRIVPGLIIILIATWLYGYQRLQTDEYSELLKHIASAAFFISNFTYLGEVGYFDSASDVKPLLHLWSLAIEEQFYIFWPIVIYLSWKIKRLLIAILMIGIVISFSISLYQVNIDVAKAFYLPNSRFWELLLGSIIAYSNFKKITISTRYRTKRIIDILSIIGLCLIISGYYVINKNDKFPGWYVLLPICGALILIMTNDRSYIGYKLFSNSILVKIGLISYPLYLWHWPILSFLRIEYSGLPSVEVRLAAITLSIVLASLTYGYVELNIRKKYNSNLYSLSMFIILFVMGLTATYLFTKKINNNHDINRLVNKQDTETKDEFYNYYANNPKGRWGEVFEKNFRHECNFFQIDQYFLGSPTKIPKKSIASECTNVELPKKNIVFIWGDSHAQMLYQGIKENLPENWQILQVTSSGCNPSSNYQENSGSDYCAKSNWFALETIKLTVPDVVIVAQSEGHNIYDYKEIEKKIIKYGVKKLLVIGPSPHWIDDLPKIYIRKLWETKPERTLIGINNNFMKLNEKLKISLDGEKKISYVDMIKVFCNKEGCLTRIGDEKLNNLTSWDYGHLTPIASNFFARQELVKQIIKNNE